MMEKYGPQNLQDHFMVMDTICDATQVRLPFKCKVLRALQCECSTQAPSNDLRDITVPSCYGVADTLGSLQLALKNLHGYSSVESSFGCRR